MKPRLFLLPLALLSGLCLRAGVQQVTEKNSDDSLSGTIQQVDAVHNAQDPTVVTIVSGPGQLAHKLLLVTATTITFKAKPANLAAVVAGRKIDCIGHSEKGQFIAKSCAVQ